jgi:hypothetical protein
MTEKQADEMIMTLKEMAIDLERIRDLMERRELERDDLNSATKP